MQKNHFKKSARKYTQAVLKFSKRNTQARQREAVAQGRSLSPYRLGMTQILYF
ncbi:MAG: hypothetical protein LBJ00_06385 [Planctomycetaceae bacterium]|nr:hypothetical protein [Planctomycetaceae bacterium]